MGHGDRLAQHVEQRRGKLLPTVILAACLGEIGETLLDDLQIPVTQLPVDEVIETERGMGEVVLLDARGGVSQNPREVRIQRSSTVLGNGCGSTACARSDPRLASIRTSAKRAALNSLLASACPCWTFSAE